MFTPSGIVTLTTDFGLQDPFVATMKGRILTRFPAARIIDITHEIPVHWPGEAGFWLARSWHYFPEGSVHLAVVDPGVGTRRDMIVVVGGGHAFLAPDNGLLAPVITELPAPRIYRLQTRQLQRFNLGTPSATFHGRDIFAPIAGELAAARCQPQELGIETQDYVPGWIEEPQIIGQAIHGRIVTVDHFGNLITNIPDTSLQRLTGPVVHAGNHRFPLRRAYGDVQPGEYLALINSFGVVEIAQAEQSAAASLGLGRGAPVNVTASLGL